MKIVDCKACTFVSNDVVLQYSCKINRVNVLLFCCDDFCTRINRIYGQSILRTDHHLPYIIWVHLLSECLRAAQLLISKARKVYMRALDRTRRGDGACGIGCFWLVSRGLVLLYPPPDGTFCRPGWQQNPPKREPKDQDDSPFLFLDLERLGFFLPLGGRRLPWLRTGYAL